MVLQARKEMEQKTGIDMCVTSECRVWLILGLYAVLALHGVIVGRTKNEAGSDIPSTTFS